MDPAGLPALLDAIRHLHGCAATFAETVPIIERFRGAVVWAGEVQVFDLPAGAPAPRCYAWSYETTGTKRQFVAVLHVPPVDSPLAAVRAYIVQSARAAKVEKR